jgi:hypothetical protein
MEKHEWNAVRNMRHSARDSQGVHRGLPQQQTWRAQHAFPVGTVATIVLCFAALAVAAGMGKGKDIRVRSRVMV